ncbi:MAG: hypothetical protein ACK47V_14015, partial [Betaproteobacteria bacterium]
MLSPLPINRALSAFRAAFAMRAAQARCSIRFNRSVFLRPAWAMALAATTLAGHSNAQTVADQSVVTVT